MYLQVLKLLNTARRSFLLILCILNISSWDDCRNWSLCLQSHLLYTGLILFDLHSMLAGKQRSNPYLSLQMRKLKCSGDVGLACERQLLKFQKFCKPVVKHSQLLKLKPYKRIIKCIKNVINSPNSSLLNNLLLFTCALEAICITVSAT